MEQQDLSQSYNRIPFPQAKKTLISLTWQNCIPLFSFLNNLPTSHRHQAQQEFVTLYPQCTHKKFVSCFLYIKNLYKRDTESTNCSFLLLPRLSLRSNASNLKWSSRKQVPSPPPLSLPPSPLVTPRSPHPLLLALESGLLA